MLNISWVVFSMTLVVLSLASSQLGPRLLRIFMRDTSTQVVLGTFAATYLYCLLVFNTIRLLETITVIAGFVHRPEDRSALMRQAEMIARGAGEALPEEEDRREVEALWKAFLHT
ncbi:MAG: DUF2254 family protein [Kiritimatiellia bacterium]